MDGNGFLLSFTEVVAQLKSTWVGQNVLVHDKLSISLQFLVYLKKCPSDYTKSTHRLHQVNV